MTHLKNDLLNFLRTMVTAGCSFRDIAQICFQGRENIISDTRIKSDDHMVHQEAVDKYKEKLTSADTFQEIQEAYVTCIDSVLWEIHSQVSKDSSIEINKLTTRRLCNLLSTCHHFLVSLMGMMKTMPLSQHNQILLFCKQ